MSFNLIVISAIFSLSIITTILILVIKKEINIKYAIIWLVLFVLIIVFILVPGLLEWFTNALGFQTSSNMIICIFIAMLTIINIALSVALSRKSKNIIELTQEIAILKHDINNK